MNRNDEQLIQQFMQTNKRDIADNGFSRKVMHHLPISAQMWSDILTVICVISCCILFYIYDGFSLILQSIREIFLSQSSELMNNPHNLLTLIVALATLSFLCIKSLWTIKE